MVIVTNVTLFTVLTYLPTYLSRTFRLNSAQALATNLAPMSLLVVLIPVFAAIADRTSHKAEMIVASLVLLVFAIPLFTLLGSADVVTKMAMLAALNLLLAILHRAFLLRYLRCSHRSSIHGNGNQL